jgi:hypothetical protein
MAEQLGALHHTTRGNRANRLTLVASILLLSQVGCSQIGVDPDEPAAIELESLPSPSIVIGDSLRNAEGVATPLRAIVRNIRGEIIDAAPVTYVYAEYNRDSALVVDPVTGFVTAVKQPTGEARIAARVGGALQVLRSITVSARPDSMDRVGQPDISQLVTRLPDDNTSSALANTSAALNVVVRSIGETDGVTTTTPVRNWLVRYVVVMPANPTNDSSAAVFLVNDAGRASTVDTTDAQGVASRKVRVRAALFPASTQPDSVVVEATANYRGTTLRGAPVRIVVPVRRSTTTTAARRD